MDTRQLELGFKGQRTYIQGGDIFNAVTAIAREADPDAYLSVLAFRDFARGDCDLQWTRPAPERRLIAQGSAAGTTPKRPFWVTASDRPASGRNPFDEDSITRPASLAGNRIELGMRSVYSPIEEIIALTKTLNYALSPDVDGKWVFGQINLRSALPETYSMLAIERTSEIAGRFSVNQIVVDDTLVGDIRFIVGDP